MRRLHLICIRCACAAAFFGGVVAVHAASRQAAASAEPRVIEVVARRYAYEPAEIQVTEGETVRLMVHSADGLHGFEIKPLKIKKALERGADPITIEFTAGAPGRYPILCSEFCGDGHGDMKGALVVVAREAGDPAR